MVGGVGGDLCVVKNVKKINTTINLSQIKQTYKQSKNVTYIYI